MTPGPRLLLAWLADRRTVLRRLIGALKPGGWLVAEELDFGSAVPDPRMGADLCTRFARIVAAHHAVIADRHGFEPAYGRRVAGDLADAGLTHGGCLGRASMWRRGDAGGEIWRLSLMQLREGIIASGLMKAADGRRPNGRRPRCLLGTPWVSRQALAGWGSGRMITVSATAMISSTGRSASLACLRIASGLEAS